MYPAQQEIKGAVGPFGPKGQKVNSNTIFVRDKLHSGCVVMCLCFRGKLEMEENRADQDHQDLLDVLYDFCFL